MDWKPLLETHFEGGDVAPGRVRSKDIADLIMAIEDLISIMVTDRHSNIEINGESIVVGLSAINPGSLAMCFDTNDHELSSAAADDVKVAFDSNRVGTLPLEARKRVGKIIAFNKRYGCSCKTSLLNGHKTEIFQLTPDTEIPYTPGITGETTLYGHITRVGGSEKPRIQFKTIQGQLMHCDASKEIAVKAGKLLYDSAALKGVAEWNLETKSIEQFSITEILEYKETSISDAFSLLSKRFGSSFSEIKNVDEFIANQRNG